MGFILRASDACHSKAAPDAWRAGRLTGKSCRPPSPAATSHLRAQRAFKFVGSRVIPIFGPLKNSSSQNGGIV
ncbi:hypothetical protein Dda_7814 [Drechslerella dactyloides]|uniref:Uncharacterized protein n=1 Tax=Drechslerella dactyloides TaxID=74499 RepID=A0AAD6NF04_DREDA|nr:hypothetical protein Dda_7814 [Drechslerella dactyloides]